MPELSRRAGALYDSMDFGFYYRPDVNRILFHYVPDTGEAACCYDTVVSESRIASYIGIAKGEIPARHYFGTWRSFPDSCDWCLAGDAAARRVTRRYLGVDVFEGAYPYCGHARDAVVGRQHVRGADAAPVRARGPLGAGQLGRRTTRSPCGPRSSTGCARRATATGASRRRTCPRAATRAYGVDGVGMDPSGYPSNEDATLVDSGFAGCPAASRSRRPRRPRTRTAWSRRTRPSWRCAGSREQALDNLDRLRRDFPGLYGKWGFRDSVNVDSGVVSSHYLSLDQGMIMAAIGNALGRRHAARASCRPKARSGR